MKKKATTRAKRREAPALLSRMTALEERMVRMELNFRQRDRHWARLVAPIVGVVHQLDEITRHLRVHTIALDSFLKQFDPSGEGIARFQAQVDAELAAMPRVRA